jgi:8-oxo-dGTP pyrophosphatase MutT (NUDIX family)
MPSDAPTSSPRPILRDPHRIPVIGTDSHLPAVEPEHLNAATLRERLAGAQDWPPPIPGDGARPEWFGERQPAAASVLVPLVQRPQGLQVLLTRRTDHLRDHAGQISFPRAGVPNCTMTDAVATALREAEEEVGLSARVGRSDRPLPVYTTVTRFRRHPGGRPGAADFTLQLDAFEVAEAFEVPLQFLMTPATTAATSSRCRGGGASSCPCPGRADGDAGPRILHLGRHRGHAAQPVRLPARLTAGLAGYHRSAMSFFAVLFALLIEQLKPLPRDNWVHDTLVSWVGWTGRNFDAGGRTTPAGWCGACRCSCRPCGLGDYLPIAH